MIVYSMFIYVDDEIDMEMLVIDEDSLFEEFKKIVRYIAIN